MAKFNMRMINISKFIKILLILILALSISLIFIKSINAYSYPKLYWWDHSPIKVYIDDRKVPTEYHPDYKMAVIDAMKEWESGKIGVNYRLGSIRFTQIDNPMYADIIIRWIKTFDDPQWLEIGEKEKAGYAKLEYELDTKRIHRAEIFLECGYFTGIIWTSHNRENMKRLAAHEIGHALGLEHSDDPNDIMYPSFKLREGIAPQTWEIVITTAALFSPTNIIAYFGNNYKR
jgi:predicted Zn-dependent protease